MKKIFTLLLLLSLASPAFADGPVIQTTIYTRTLLHSPDAPTARTVLGISAAGYVNYLQTPNYPLVSGGISVSNWESFVPNVVQVWMICTNADAATGLQKGELISGDDVFFFGGEPSGPFFSANAIGTNFVLTAKATASLNFLTRPGGTYTAPTSAANFNYFAILAQITNASAANGSPAAAITNQNNIFTAASTNVFNGPQTNNGPATFNGPVFANGGGNVITNGASGVTLNSPTINGTAIGSIQYAIAAGYLDTNVAAFAITNGLQPGSQAVKNMEIGVSAVKQLGVWSNFQDVLLLPPIYAPSNHLSLMLNPWTAQNEIYNSQGFGMIQFSNQIKFSLPYAISNCTVVFSYVSDAHHLDDIGQGVFSSHYAVDGDLLDLMSTNDGSSLVWSGETGAGLQVKVSQGANYGITITNILNNYRTWLWPMANGYFDSSQEHLCQVATVVTLTIKNGVLKIYYNTLPVEFCNSYGGGAGSQTNAFAFSVPAPFTTFHWGGGNTNWTGKLLDTFSGYYGTNGFGATLTSVSFWNNDIDDSPAIRQASYVLAQSLMPTFDKAVALQGSSILAKVSRIPNGLAYNLAQSHPDVLVLDESEQASALSAFSSCVNGWTNGISFPNTDLTWLPPEKYDVFRKVATDAPRNDVGAYTPAQEVQLFLSFYTNYLNAGCRVELIETHFATGFGTGSNYYSTGLGPMFDAITTNFPLSAVWNEAAQMPLEYLTNVSGDTPPVHIDGQTLYAQMAMKSFGNFIMGDGWTYPWQGPVSISEMQWPNAPASSNQVAQVASLVVSTNQNYNTFTNLPAWYRAGYTNVTMNSTTFVSFSSPMGSTNYVVTVTPGNTGNSQSPTYAVQSFTTNGFTLYVQPIGGSSGTFPYYWIAMLSQ